MVAAVIAVLGQGLLAGLAVALPLGAIGVLLLHEGFTRGWPSAAAGATGVALVDLGYVTVALAAGSVVTRALAGHERTVRLVGAAVLLAVAAHGILAVWRLARTPDAAQVSVPDADVAPAPRRPIVVLGRFVALTALNPLTAVYFTVLAAGLAVHGLANAVWFALGVFLASWTWQLGLAGIGAAAGERLPRAVRTAVSLAGYAIVVGYAVRLALR